MEENQHFAMETWKACGNGEGWFALKVEDEIIMIPHFSMVALSYEKSTLNLTDIREYGTPLERWLKKGNANYNNASNSNGVRPDFDSVIE